MILRVDEEKMTYRDQIMPSDETITQSEPSEMYTAGYRREDYQ